MSVSWQNEWVYSQHVIKQIITAFSPESRLNIIFIFLHLHVEKPGLRINGKNVILLAINQEKLLQGEV